MKDEKQIEIERKEQGFALYVNGANAKIPPKQDRLSTHGARSSRKTKTAGSGETVTLGAIIVNGLKVKVI